MTVSKNGNDDKSKKGISIRDALAIMDARSESGGERHGNSMMDGEGNAISDEQKNMGQTIDLLAWTKMGKGQQQSFCPETDDFDGNNVDPSLKSQRLKDAEEGKKKIDENRKQRDVEIKTRLQTLSVSELINALFEAQRERVVTYKEFDKYVIPRNKHNSTFFSVISSYSIPPFSLFTFRGLEQVLKTGNISNYPPLCAKITASFSVLSQSINMIGQILDENHKRKDLGKIIRQLQSLEKEKLNTTAALHLEQIREKNETMNQNQAISDLLQDGIKSLRMKLGNIIPNINDVLEELRFEMD